MAYSPSNQGSFETAYGAELKAQGCNQASLGGGIASASLANYAAAQQTCIDYAQTAYDILEDIAKRAVTQPHKLPEAEIQILAAFVLGYNSK